MNSRKGPPKGKNHRPNRPPQGKPGGYGRFKEDSSRKPESLDKAGEEKNRPGKSKSGLGRPSGSKARQETNQKPTPSKPPRPYSKAEDSRSIGTKPWETRKPLGAGPVGQKPPYPKKPFPGKTPMGRKPSGMGFVPPGSNGRPIIKQKRLAAPPSKQELGRLMALYGVELEAKTLDKLWGYHQLLRANNGDQDLTRLIGFDTIAQRHYADCMILHGLMRGKWPSPLVDVGSGAGFPGIMIKLMSPGTTIVLAEPRPRRVQFLEMVIKELGLKDISVFGHKVTSRSLTRPFAGVITRAFETVESTLPRLGGCLGIGGQAIFMKGPKVAEEMAVFNNDEYRILRNHPYKIPNTSQERVLVVLERTKVPEPGSAIAYDPSQEADFQEPRGENG
jgi:16S rRNA (guanine527-N7)-methyltransferase